MVLKPNHSPVDVAAYGKAKSKEPLTPPSDVATELRRSSFGDQ